jgi:hypothetical protein
MTLQFSNKMTSLSAYMTTDFETIKKTIYDHNIKNSNKISFKLKDNMMLIYNDFVKTPSKDDLFNYSRSIILTNVNDLYNIVSYTHPVIDYNNQTKLAEMKDKQFTECYEGTLISVYYCNDKWNYSTRKCLDANDSHWTYNGKTCSKSHYDMFVESLGVSKDDFEKELDQAKSYYFVIVHHENKIFVDYTSRFGSEYKKLFLLFVRDSTMKVCDESKEFFKPMISSEVFSLEDVKQKIQTDENILGYLMNDTTTDQMFVYHTKFYSNLERAAPYAAAHESMLIELYKRDNLNDHILAFPENVKYKETGFDTKGVMFGVITYLSFSLINLYYYFTMFDGQKLTHKNAEDFKTLFEDKNQTLQSMLYKMKGIVLANKRKLEIDDVKKMIKYYINTNDLVRSLKEFEEIKKTDMSIFTKMNPKYKLNAIVDGFIQNL